jgi:hypothetical protein
MRIHQYNELLNDQNQDVMTKINSIIDYLNQVGKLSNDVVKDWNTVYQWVMNDGLTTDVNNKMEDMLSKGEFNTLFNTVLGDLTTLTTPQKDNVVHALNSVQTEIATNTANIAANTTSLAQNTSQLTNLKNITGINMEIDFPKQSGDADDSARIQRAINSIPSPVVKETIIFGATQYNVGTTINLPNIKIQLISFVGSLINVTSSNPAFSQVNHARIEIRGFKFQGSGIGIQINTPLSSSYNYDFEITNCHFYMNSGIYGISITGTREGLIKECYFEGGNGIYRTQCTNTNISFSQFHNCGYGIFDDGDNTAYSDGMFIDHVIMLGCAQAVVEQYVDYFSITNSMIDYNDQPLQIYGVLNAYINGCYFSSRTNNATIVMGLGTKFSNVRNQNIKINNSFILGHATTGTFNCIEMDSADNVVISECDISFYLTYGIKYSNCTKLKFSQNNISPRATFGTNSIYCSASDDSSNYALFNTLTQFPSTQYMIYRDNRGYTNRARGTASIGSGVTSVVVTHNLSIQPTYVNAFPQGGSASNIGSPWVDTINATQFTIHVPTAPSGTIIISWEASFGS